MRVKLDDAGSAVQQGDASVDKSQGAARAISSFIDPGLSWKDLPWFKSITKMPIILKVCVAFQKKRCISDFPPPRVSNAGKMLY